MTMAEHYECNHCDWDGPKSETVHPKHDATFLVCPKCHETLNQVAPLTAEQLAADVERARMEEHYCSLGTEVGWGRDRKTGNYHAKYARDAWSAWQAARTSVEPAACPPYDKKLNDSMEAIGKVLQEELASEGFGNRGLANCMGMAERIWRAVNPPDETSVGRSVNRTHEECAECALEKVEPPQCGGHAPGPVHCEQFRATLSPAETPAALPIDWKSAYEEVLRQRDALQADANRYRWLRNSVFVEGYWIDGVGGVDTKKRVEGMGDYLDQVIDMERIKDAPGHKPVSEKGSLSDG